MLDWRVIYHKLLNSLIRVFVKSKAIPNDPITELNLDLSRPIVYVLPYRSSSDLLTVRTQCLANGLPDPLIPNTIDEHSLPSYVFVNEGASFISRYIPIKQDSVKIFHDYLDLHHNDPQLDIQLLPVSVLFGRSPGREGQNTPPYLRALNGPQKLFALLWLGRDSFVRFSHAVSLRNMANEHGTDQSIAQKLVRVAHMHFSRQRRAAVGPQLPVRQELFNKLLQSKAIEKAVEDEARNKKITSNKARQNAIDIMEEIAANFNYETLRLSGRVLSWTWNRLYQGINVHNVENVRRLAHEGHELVYVPCHRSHMDYLLLSYVLYHQGLVPPHIAAGINLNFWPAGPIFRRLGAFFIRRSFKSNKLYSTVFREYLGELFTRGYSVEYFVEGGRSRTGRLLEPQTGTLSMTLHAMLRGGTRPITLIPVYIGYEHVMEVGTYAKELRGATKEKENLLQVLIAMRKLRKLGQGYVNFGEPIPLIPFLNQRIPDWREAIDPIEPQRPSWLSPVVHELAKQVMVNINNAAAANAINLCATAILASRQRALTREQLITQLDCYIQLLQRVPYSPYATTPPLEAEALLDHALAMDKFEVDKDNLGDIILLPREQAVLMTYYRNNIQHMLILPSIIATIIARHQQPSITEVIELVTLLYPMLREELFMCYPNDNLPELTQTLIDELLQQQLILQEGETLTLNPVRLPTLQLLAAIVKETLQRYTITFSLLTANPAINRTVLEKESRHMAQRLSVLHGINAPEFFDKAVFSTLVNTLRAEGYIDESGHAVPKKTNYFYHLIRGLLTTDIRLTIDSDALLYKAELTANKVE